MLRGILGQLVLPKVGIKPLGSSLGLGKSHGVWEIGNFQKKPRKSGFGSVPPGKEEQGWVQLNVGRVGKKELVEFCRRLQRNYQGLDGPWSTQGKWEL